MSTFTTPDLTPPPPPTFPPAPESPSQSPPSIKLFDQYSVLIATFLGAPLAGCALLAINFSRLGMHRQAWLTFMGGVLGTAAMVALGMMIPDSVHGVNVLFLVAQLGIMKWLATRLQGLTFQEHVAAGGLISSKWSAAGIGVASLALLCAAILGLVILTTGPSGTRLSIGSSGIYYTGSATESDAQALAAALKKLGWHLEDRPITVQLSRDAAGFTLCFVVKSENRDNPERVEDFRTIGHEITKAAPLSPLTIWLCDDDMIRQKKIVIE